MTATSSSSFLSRDSILDCSIRPPASSSDLSVYAVSSHALCGKSVARGVAVLGAFAAGDVEHAAGGLHFGGVPDATGNHDGAAAVQGDALHAVRLLQQQLQRTGQQVHELVSVRMHF